MQEKVMAEVLATVLVSTIVVLPLITSLLFLRAVKRLEENRQKWQKRFEEECFYRRLDDELFRIWWKSKTGEEFPRHGKDGSETDQEA